MGLEKQQDQYADAVKALSDTALTRLVLVARAQASTLKEVSHTHEELSAIGLQHQHLAINGVLPPLPVNRIRWRTVFWRGRNGPYGPCLKTSRIFPVDAVSEAF
ncbi:hypothetical protein J4730_29110 [Klebsiella pneumoniae]|uniref:ArsA/GET3 Anion-transporting ATPase-like domain-containing protein n=1 Tax=Klebsiella pneumoniae TaxID=573 RepID=A0A939NPX4_KLEPN|nr:hypothetical protein [Klebsiella pneumoniae]